MRCVGCGNPLTSDHCLRCELRGEIVPEVLPKFARRTLVIVSLSRHGPQTVEQLAKRINLGTGRRNLGSGEVRKMIARMEAEGIVEREPPRALRPGEKRAPGWTPTGESIIFRLAPLRPAEE